MDFSSGGEGSAVLQLQKWRPSDVQLNLSQFREAFISPTRELLSLLSYQCEAMLLPLVKGEIFSAFLACECASLPILTEIFSILQGKL